MFRYVGYVMSICLYYLYVMDIMDGTSVMYENVFKRRKMSGTFHFRNEWPNCPGTDLGVRPGTVLVNIVILWS